MRWVAMFGVVGLVVVRTCGEQSDPESECTLEQAEVEAIELCERPPALAEMASATRDQGGAVVIAERVGALSDAAPRVSPVDRVDGSSGFLADEADAGEVQITDGLGSGLIGTLEVRAWTGRQYNADESGQPACDVATPRDGVRCFFDEQSLQTGTAERVLFLLPDGGGYWLRWSAALEGGEVSQARTQGASEGPVSLEVLR